MKRVFELILNRCKKRHPRGQGIRFIGLKSVECSLNPEMKTDKPHFHVIVPSKEVTDLLVSEWLKQWKPKEGYRYASPKAQNSKVIRLEHSLIGTIKCWSIIFTKPDLKKKGKQAVKPMIYTQSRYASLLVGIGILLIRYLKFLTLEI